MKNTKKSHQSLKLLLSFAAAAGTALMVSGCTFPAQEINAALNQVESMTQAAEDATAPLFTFEELVNANTREATLSRHQNSLSVLTPADDGNGGIQAFSFGFNKHTLYCEPDYVYTERDVTGLWEGQEYYDELYTKAGNLFFRDRFLNGDEVPYYTWYPTEDASPFYGVDYFSVLADGSDAGEKLVSTRDNGDGTLTAITCMPFDEDDAAVNAPSEFTGGTEVYEYTVDADTLELLGIKATLVSESGKFDFSEETVVYDAEAPEKFASLRDVAVNEETKEPENPYTTTLVFDPGTPEEKTYTKKLDSSCRIGFYLPNGYSLYEDPEGKIPLVPDKNRRDFTYYAIKD